MSKTAFEAMSTSDSMGDGPPNKKARFGDDSGKRLLQTSHFFPRFKLRFKKVLLNQIVSQGFVDELLYRKF